MNAVVTSRVRFASREAKWTRYMREEETDKVESAVRSEEVIVSKIATIRLERSRLHCPKAIRRSRRSAGIIQIYQMLCAVTGLICGCR